MSNLRFFGVIAGLIGIILTFAWYRGPRWRKGTFLMFFSINLIVVIVSLRPDAVNILRDVLAMKEYAYGRLFALLITSNLFLLMMAFYLKIKQDVFSYQFDRLVRKVAASDFSSKTQGEPSVFSEIMVLIPALNEAENLAELLPRIPAEIKGRKMGVLVVDDGSDDGTAEVVKNNGCLVVSNPINRGGGAALRTGYDILQAAGVSICVTMDADCQHDPAEIEKLVAPIISGGWDIVIGSRILGEWEKESKVRWVGVYFFAYLISLLTGKRITDPSSNFRAINLDAVRDIALKEDQYHTAELIISALKKGLRITEVPITILKRKHGTSKKGKDLIYGLNFARAVLSAWWR